MSVRQGAISLRTLWWLSFLLLATLGCSLVTDVLDDEDADAAPRPIASPAVQSTPSLQPPAESATGKWALWASGRTELRGANIWQSGVIPELDGSEFKGSGRVGPPYTQQDFDRLASLGANYVNISHPGLFTETPPFNLDEGVQQNLDNLLAMIAQADMFAVISFRTGPGRSEYSLCCLEEAGNWLEADYLNDTVWQDREAQDAWADMWRHTAERYWDSPVVVGYDLMVEPNSNEVGSDALNDALDIWEPEEFYDQYRGTLYDWNQLYPRITAAIRQADADTPILIGAMSYSVLEWLPYLVPTGDGRTVYAVHQYEPFDYTHQEPGLLGNLPLKYPDEVDLDYDGVDDRFDRAWMDAYLSPIDDFVATYGFPVTVNEFGVMRWQPGAAAYMADEMALFEERGINYALWEWQTSWEPFVQEVHTFDFRLGPDPDNRTDLEISDLQEVISSYWQRNTRRPSNFPTR